MKSQWDCIRENIGVWRGSFTQFSADGQPEKDTPSVLTLEETEQGEKMQLTLERTPPGESTNIVKRDFSAPGPAPYVYFFENGAFSQGSSQWAAFSQFGAEMSIRVGDRRVRFVIMYESTVEGTSEIKYVTLIRETREEGISFEQPDLSLQSLNSSWTGEIAVLHASMEPLSKGHSEWQLDATALENREQFDEVTQSVSLSSEDVDLTADKPAVLQGDLAYVLMPLPNGTYCFIPQTIRKGEAFRIEVGWLEKEDARSRLIRYYDAQGVWTHTGLIEDQRSTQ